MLDLPLLSATMRDCRHKLPRADNVGASNDWRDLYYLVDYLTFALASNYDGQPCKLGCSLCCRENSIFRVSGVEWAAIAAYLEQQDEASIEALLARNEALYGSHYPQLAEVADCWRRSLALSAENPHLAGLPSLCPALVDDRCAIYEARPLVCRAYGYFAVKVRDAETLMICRTKGQGFLDSLKEQGLDHAQLPNFEPFDRQLRSLDASGIVKPLPLWLSVWRAQRRQQPDSEHEPFTASLPEEMGEAILPADR